MQLEPDPPLLERLDGAMNSLRPSERKVGELVAQDPTFVVSATMAQLAEAAGVSEPTVMRFCTGLGFDGFQAFRTAVAQALAIGLPATLSSIGRSDTIAQIAGKTFDHTITSLDRARRYLDFEQIGRAVDAITRASSMVLVGLGASAIIAADAEQKAPLFGIPCSAPLDSHQQFMAASMARSGSVLVAISNTGRTLSVVRVAEIARRNGAVVIGISGDQTPLLGQCDIPIVVRTIEDTDVYTPTVSRLAGLVIIDILATAVALTREQTHMDRLTQMKEDLTTFRRSVS